MKRAIILILFLYPVKIVTFGQQDNLLFQPEKFASSDTHILYIGVINQFEFVIPNGEEIQQICMKNSKINVIKNKIDISVFMTGISTLFVVTNKRSYSLVFNSQYLKSKAKKLTRTTIVLN